MTGDHDDSQADELEAALDREIEEALAGQSLLNLDAPAEDGPALEIGAFGIGVVPRHQPVKIGAFAEARVAGVGQTDVFLELGLRQQGVIPRAQFGAAPEEGQTIKVFVVEHDTKESLYICSIRAQIRGAGAALQTGDVVRGTVRSANAGGLELQIGVHSAFMPASHIALERVEDLEALVGESWPVEVVEVDPERRRVVVSRRSVLRREQDDKRASAVSQLMPGATVKGPITRIERFGAFVDLGGVEGLVHVSELAHKRVESPQEVVEVGQVLTVSILEIEEEGRRIRLSAKALIQDPFDAFVAAHPAGHLVEGTVTRIASYGAFFEVAEGVEGLAHVSQLAPGGVSTPKEVVKIGQTATVRVVAVEPERRRIGLSLLSDRGDRLTDDVADDATIEQYARGSGEADEPTLGDLLRRALEGGE